MRRGSAGSLCRSSPNKLSGSGPLRPHPRIARIRKRTGNWVAPKRSGPVSRKAARRRSPLVRPTPSVQRVAASMVAACAKRGNPPRKPRRVWLASFEEVQCSWAAHPASGEPRFSGGADMKRPWDVRSGAPRAPEALFRWPAARTLRSSWQPVRNYAAPNEGKASAPIDHGSCWRIRESPSVEANPSYRGGGVFVGPVLKEARPPWAGSYPDGGREPPPYR